ncbi:hypothetical protein RJ640_028092 [Escallonia rubra]|uniref:KIB1-4 beta-propeller domain-containing protein n=1 Tax=Escallonia rubra TaxID=112253 RepID=A0AA88UC31_9ASTE|nr:hypothetical protein RJ640_028092 [Escallonia rubra]
MEEMMEQKESHCPPPLGQYPWFVISHGEGCEDQTFCTLPTSAPKHVRRCSIPELRGKEIISYCHGWVILSDHKTGMLCNLWNPVTSESIHLPPIELKQIEYIALSSPPGDPDAIVLLFRGENTPAILFCPILHGKSWTEMKYGDDDIYEDGIEDDLSTPVSCNGKVYAISHIRLVLIEIVAPNRLAIRPLQCEIPLNFSDHCISCQGTYHLVESCGELFCMCSASAGMPEEDVNIHIFKLDFSSMTWEEVKSAQNRVFFIGGGYQSSLSCPAVEPDTEGNYIHFMFPEFIKSLYSYNIEDKSILLSLLCPDVPTPCHNPVWLIPQRRLIDECQANRTTGKEEQGRKEEEIEVRERGNDEMIDVEKKGGLTDGHLMNLSYGILELIADRCIPIGYMKFRATSKCFRSAIPPVQWRTASARLQTHTLSPWLVLYDKNKRIMTFIDPQFGDRYFITISDLIGDAIICASNFGWLLMVRGDRSIFFFNPFTRNIIQLPDLPLGLFSSFSFSSMPTSLDCQVVAVRIPCLEKFDVHVTSPGRSDWVFFTVSKEVPYPYRNSPIFSNSKFHLLGSDGNLADFDFDFVEGYAWEVLDVPIKPCNSGEQKFLVDCGGDLVSVFLEKHGERVQVFRLNRSTPSWEKVESLGNYMIFISHSSSFAAVSKTTGMENKIYFPWLSGEDLIFYSLDTCKLHKFGSTEPLMNFYGATEQRLCGWIEPNWSSHS